MYFYNSIVSLLALAGTSINIEPIHTQKTLKIAIPHLLNNIEALENECLYYLMKFQEYHFDYIASSLIENNKKAAYNMRINETDKYGIFVVEILKITIKNLQDKFCDEFLIEDLNLCLLNHQSLITKHNNSLNTYSKKHEVSIIYEFSFDTLYKKLQENSLFKTKILFFTCEFLKNAFVDKNERMFDFISFFRRHFYGDYKSHIMHSNCVFGNFFDFDREKIMLLDPDKEYNSEKLSNFCFSELIMNVFKIFASKNQKNSILFLNFDFTNALFIEIIKNFKILRKIDFTKITKKILSSLETRPIFPKKINDCLEIFQDNKISIILIGCNEFSFDKLIEKMIIFFRDTDDLDFVIKFKKKRQQVEKFVIRSFELLKTHIDYFNIEIKNNEDEIIRKKRKEEKSTSLSNNSKKNILTNIDNYNNVKFFNICDLIATKSAKKVQTGLFHIEYESLFSIKE